VVLKSILVLHESLLREANTDCVGAKVNIIHAQLLRISGQMLVG
jgi:hypothetical protein